MTDLPQTLAFIDVETTGGGYHQDRIIEIGIIRVENGRVVEEFESLFNPHCFLPTEIEVLTGITRQDLETAPDFEAHIEKIQELLDGAVFVAHNARFDYGFVKSELKRCDVSFSAKQLCTRRLSQKLFPEYKRHNLDIIIERFGFSCRARHRALGDAAVVWDFYQHVLTFVPQEKVSEVCKILLKNPSLPPQLPAEMIQNLPESPGVYIFYGDEGVPLYVGKSVNIRDRVLSHFASDHTESRELKITQQIKSVDVVQTSGELGALITESQLVKSLQPLFNRKLRHAYKMLMLTQKETADGFATVELEEISELTASDAQSVLSIFRTRRQAKETLSQLAKEYNLCQKLLGLEKINSACFGYQLGWCKGACCGKEKAEVYNLRFVQAFADRKIARWPYATPVVISEIGEDGRQEAHLVDKWCYLGKVTADGDTSDTKLLDTALFDFDLYKILKGYLQKKQRSFRIKPVTMREIQQLDYSM